MKYKMIVSDYDDTFIKDDFTYSQELVNIVNKYVNKGGKFLIATGRMTEAIRPKCLDMGLKGEVIGYQGALIQDIETGKDLAAFPIYWEDALEVAQWIEMQGYYYHIYQNDNFLYKDISKYTSIYRNYVNADPIKLDMNISCYIENNKFSPLKMMILTEPENVAEIISQMTDKFGSKMLFNTSKEWIVEMINKNTNKGVAVERIAHMYGIKQEEIICIGDSANDIEMIKYAGLGVVVENGSDYAKKYADLIAPSNQDEGVAYIIKKYGLEEI